MTLPKHVEDSVHQTITPPPTAAPREDGPMVELPVRLVTTLMLACALNEGLDVPNMGGTHVFDTLAGIEKRMKAAGHGNVYDWVELWAKEYGS